tara:strand:+ start:2547 stop:3698 length:1152 start_codon:yes stop_codon:yes gene_type:complete
MKNKENLFFICTKLPWPLDSGQNLRAFNLLKYFSKEYHLNLICISEDISRKKELQKQIKFKKFILVKQGRLDVLYGIIQGLLSFKPIQVARFKSKKMQKELLELSNSNHIFFFHLDRAAQYEHLISSDKKYLDMCDVSSKRYYQNYKDLSFFDFKKWIFLYEYFAALRSENFYPNKFKKVFLHSAKEVDERNLVSKNKIFTQSTMGISNLTSGHLWSKQSNKILFIGTLNYHPNLSGVKWFIKNILINFKDLELHIVGTVKRFEKDELEKNMNVFCHGFVENLEDLGITFSFGISPIFSAAGIQNKIIDYISFGLPIVASKESLQGFSSLIRKEICEANLAKDWVELFSNPIQINHSPVYLKQCIQKEHSWIKITQKIIGSLK